MRLSSFPPFSRERFRIVRKRFLFSAFESSSRLPPAVLTAPRRPDPSGGTSRCPQLPSHVTPSDLERPAIGRGRADSVAWLPFLLKSSHRGVQLQGLGALLPDALSARTCGVRSRACAITEWPTAFWWFRCIVSRLRMRERAWRDEERFFALLRMTMRGTTDGRWDRPRNTSDEALCSLGRRDPAPSMDDG